jgi:hypothetical protein
MAVTETFQRVAFSPREFAALFGKELTWGYRQLYAGKVKSITDHGRIMIPAKEVERILGTAGVYNGLKPKVAKLGKKLEGWRRFIEEERKAKPKRVKVSAVPLLGRLRAASGDAREAALSRLPRGPNL